jgi:hypothetical protein
LKQDCQIFNTKNEKYAKYQNNIPMDTKYTKNVVQYSKWSKNIPTFSIPRHSKIYPNCVFGTYENIPSGNPGMKFTVVPVTRLSI